MQLKRRNHQLVQARNFALVGQQAKHALHILRELGVAGDVAEVGVELGRAWVVVAGGQMGVTANAAPLTARDQQHLGMGFQPHHAVHHLSADVFELFSPVDVGLFVKAGLQFDHHRHLFAALHRFAQQLHQAGISPGAVNGLFDG